MPAVPKPEKRKKRKKSDLTEGLKYSKRKATRNTMTDDQHFKPVDKDEARLQAQCEEWLEICKIDYLHIPNQAFQGNRNVASKYLKGWPDFIILTKSEKDNRALFIELKTKQGELTQGQKNRMKNLNYFVVRSLDDFVEKVEEFLNANQSNP